MYLKRFLFLVQKHFSLILDLTIKRRVNLLPLYYFDTSRYFLGVIRSMDEKKGSVEEAAEKTGEVIGKGVKKGWGTVKAFGKGVKEGVSKEKKEEKKE